DGFVSDVLREVRRDRGAGLRVGDAGRPCRAPL
ncbi:MAG: hypothetical protein AVDCRST_MAG17-764, partial [uncultured Solirubrobacterales bacterium]